MYTPFHPSQQVRATLEAMNNASHRGQPFFFVLDFELQEGIFVPEPLQRHDGTVFFSFPSAKTPDPIGLKRRIALRSRPESPENYARRFAIIHRGLMRGDSFLTNLTLRTPIETDSSLEDIYLSSEATYRILLPGRFVAFSPECFVKLQGDELATHPMKGTINAHLPNAAETLLADYKEGCEHHTIVDLMRNDLSRVAEGVHVRRFKYLTELHTSSGELLQMSSEVVGTIDRSDGLLLGPSAVRPRSAQSRSSKRQKGTPEDFTQVSVVTLMGRILILPSSSASSSKTWTESSSTIREVVSPSIVPRKTNTTNVCKRFTVLSNVPFFAFLH